MSISSFLKKYIIITAIANFFMMGISFANPLIEIATIIPKGYTGHSNTNILDTFYVEERPQLIIQLKNSGTDKAELSSNEILQEGFLLCKDASNKLLFTTNPIASLTILPGQFVEFPITLPSSISEQQNTNGIQISCALKRHDGIQWIINTADFPLTIYIQGKLPGNFDGILDITREQLRGKIDGPIGSLRTEGPKDFVFKLIDKIAIPGAVLLGVLLSLIALYTIMFSDDEKAFSKVSDLIVGGMIGMVVIVSAKFIGNVFVTNTLSNGELAPNQFNMVQMVGALYDNMLWPLLKMAFYIMMGVLFVILVIRIFKFLTAESEEIQKQSQQIMVSTVLGLFIMIGAKQLVEAVYGKESEIRNEGIISITQIGGSFLRDSNIPIIYDIIKWVMGLTSFVLLGLILYQTYRMLVNPTGEENMKNLRKTIFYALIGMLVIGAGYLIVNVMMVN